MGASVLSAQTSLLLFKDGRVLVNTSIPLRIPAGRSVQRFPLDEHDASSLVALDPGVVLSEVHYQGPTDDAKLYRRSVGSRVVFRNANGDTVSAVVLDGTPFRFEMAGGISLSPPGDPLFPPQLLGSGRTVEATVEAQRALERLRVSYVTTGAAWSAGYSLVIRDGTAGISGAASLRSSAVLTDSAEIILLDGVVNRVSSFTREAGVAQRMSRLDQLRLEEVVVTGAAEAAPAVMLGVGGVHLYSLSGHYGLVPGMVTVAQLFRPAVLPIERIHSIPGALPLTGNPQAFGRQAPTVGLHYRVHRGRGTPFGDLPLPGGVARLYKDSPEGSRLLIGEAVVLHTPAGADLDLLGGSSLDLSAVREETEVGMAQDSVQRADGGVNIRTVAAIRAYKVTFTNRSDSAEVVEVVERRTGPWSVITSSVPTERVVPDGMRFRVSVPPRSDAVLTYRLRIPVN
jgi:hypothetical protein